MRSRWVGVFGRSLEGVLKLGVLVGRMAVESSVQLFGNSNCNPNFGLLSGGWRVIQHAGDVSFDA